jgi:5,10-methylene-tetrahydrofolate dehydrogenase/methenyl tetrahydrofolate cyclohydrolase
LSLVTRTTNSADYRDIGGPCTTIASVELLKSSGVSLEGLEATVIGHSELVGKPIAFLLMAEGATVTACHHLSIRYPWAAPRATGPDSR